MSEPRSAEHTYHQHAAKAADRLPFFFARRCSPHWLFLAWRDGCRLRQGLGKGSGEGLGLRRVARSELQLMYQRRYGMALELGLDIAAAVKR